MTSSLPVDYRCRPCMSRQEQWVTRPVPSVLPCRLCGEPATRLFSANVGARSTSTRQETRPSSGNFYLDNRDVPGICHMSGTEARRWVAMARGDEAGQRREKERQERAVEAGVLDPSKPTGHSHGPSRPAQQSVTG